MTQAPDLPEPEAPRPSQLQRDALLESIEALAAGELEPGPARRLEGRFAAEPALAQLYADVRRVEQRLRAEPLLPLPLHLVDRILASTGIGRVRPRVVLVRAAACVLLAFGSWFAFSGKLPTLADAAPPPLLVASLEQGGLPASPNLPGVLRSAGQPGEKDAPAIAVGELLGGLLLLAAGVSFAFSSHRRAAALGARRETP